MELDRFIEGFMADDGIGMAEWLWLMLPSVCVISSVEFYARRACILTSRGRRTENMWGLSCDMVAKGFVLFKPGGDLTTIGGKRSDLPKESKMVDALVSWALDYDINTRSCACVAMMKVGCEASVCTE